MDNPEKLPT